MKNLLILLATILLISCNNKSDTLPNSLVVEDMTYFEKFHPSCEKWIEQQYPCELDSCFSSAAIEIVGIDTTDKSNLLIYAWAWNEHYLLRDDQAFSGNKQLLITKLELDATSRNYEIQKSFIPHPDSSLTQQLEESDFPSFLIKKYFTKQSQKVEEIRIQALSKKAHDKYKIYLNNNFPLDHQTPDTPSTD